jgi:hypothetical protein
MRVQGFGVGMVSGALAIWMVVGVLSSASGATGEAGGAHVSNGRWARTDAQSQR